jgi:hypothetical protein
MGVGGFDALVSAHDDKKEWTKCGMCNGSGHIHTMTDDEERDYHADYW